ncbi:MAG: hypothetical protein EXR98_19265 [Gemmataceae bacterium]|nr:hypothetical protein [Gemmataceae bacterium]
MEHLDQLVPFAVLVVITAILVVLLRRTTRDAFAAPLANQTPTRAERAPEPVAAAPPEQPAEEIVAVPKRRRQTREKPISPLVVVTATPIDAVLDLLNRKDSLATAFILREILDRPVSQRH